MDGQREKRRQVYFLRRGKWRQIEREMLNFGEGGPASQRETAVKKGRFKVKHKWGRNDRRRLFVPLEQLSPPLTAKKPRRPVPKSLIEIENRESRVTQNLRYTTQWEM
ncbi:hypothetical protein K0M31_018681 [Melipona bicolor]|uniref:Uncharacterized protein n=1 Tax=Melipona bicolor TaxID=60889 RepID=A0AA40KRX7_9HYME|nr:hypothetical protein K0M31_018681 [Melipona bicolor]